MGAGGSGPGLLAEKQSFGFLALAPLLIYDIYLNSVKI